MLLAALLLALAPPEPAPRDPFVPFDAQPQLNGPLLVPLHHLKVEGVVVATAPRAMVRTPDGTSHVVRVGDAIGTRFGRVAAIRPGVVEVREAYIDAFGITRYDTLQLRLR
jgi:Tfp pilus assembly protein PilP